MADKFAYFNDNPAFAGFKWISPSQASKVETCPWSWWASYRAEVEREPSVAMDRGTVFDVMCEHGVDTTYGDEIFQARTRLSNADIITIKARVRAQRPTMPEGRGQVPVHMPIEGTDWHLRGFVDWLPDDDSLPFRELKLATAPWQRKKLKYNWIQAISYQMMLDGRPGQFDVSNMAEAGIQVFDERDYLRRRKYKTRCDEALDYYRKMIAIIDGGDYPTTPGILCKGSNDNATWQCDYWAVCPHIIDQQSKERRINELKQVF